MKPYHLFLSLIVAVLATIGTCSNAHAEWVIEGGKFEEVTINEAVCGYYSGGYAALTDRHMNYGETAKQLQDGATRGAVRTMTNTDQYASFSLLWTDAPSIPEIASNPNIRKLAQMRTQTIADVLQQFSREECMKRLGEVIEVPKRVWRKPGVQM
uniref:Uncharacterized protein n=1 Tax=Pseudomonas phage RVTF4 TaxID=3236931 RepID=A0AB39CCB4_9VIRU